jgi:pimeloyl-ACP methyl ester carboxylesterase
VGDGAELDGRPVTVDPYTGAVADGDHDEAIKRAHTEYIAAPIPGAGLLILPNTSHFAFLQDPTLFNAALLHFLDDR